EVCRQAKTQMNGMLQALLDRLVILAKGGLERRDHVADHIFGRIVQERGELPGGRGGARRCTEDLLHQKRVLRDGEGVVAARLSVPARHAGKPVRYVGDLDVERRGIEEVETAPGKHALPRAL